MNYYLIWSSDSDPRNCSKKKIIAREDGAIIDLNNNGFDQWDAFITHMGGGWRPVAEYLITKLKKNDEKIYREKGVCITKLTEEEKESVENGDYEYLLR